MALENIYNCCVLIPPSPRWFRDAQHPNSRTAREDIQSSTFRPTLSYLFESYFTAKSGEITDEMQIIGEKTLHRPRRAFSAQNHSAHVSGSRYLNKHHKSYSDQLTGPVIKAHRSSSEVSSKIFPERAIKPVPEFKKAMHITWIQTNCKFALCMVCLLYTSDAADD